jgi:hypothetical protein
MDMVLVVVRPFGGRAVGDVIGDPHEVNDVLKGEHSADVVRAAVGKRAAATAQRRD